ncbi:MAG: hypothetical protein KAS87_03605 [Candidatus Omnitrophica bacterium]|nr:hypothetical protein [Candidatus Omnitrophota bacterium]
MEKRKELGDRREELGEERKKTEAEKQIRGGAEKQEKKIVKKKKKWVKPTITRVKLNPEMAVMGVCSTSAGNMEDNAPAGWCNHGMECRQFENPDGGNDSAASS